MKLRGVRAGWRLMVAVAVSTAACDPTPAPVAANGAATSSGGEGSRRTRRPSNDPPELVEAGRARFETACERCHGPEGTGGLLTDREVTNDRLEASLHAGSDNGGLIPAIAPDDLRPEHLPALRAYLRSVGALRVE